jgi:hypothetical protein
MHTNIVECQAVDTSKVFSCSIQGGKNKEAPNLMDPNAVGGEYLASNRDGTDYIVIKLSSETKVTKVMLRSQLAEGFTVKANGKNINKVSSSLWKVEKNICM